MNTLNRVLFESLRLWTQHCWRKLKLMFILQVSTAMFSNLDRSCMMTSRELSVSRGQNIVDPSNHCFINVLKVPWIILVVRPGLLKNDATLHHCIPGRKSSWHNYLGGVPHENYSQRSYSCLFIQLLDSIGIRKSSIWLPTYEDWSWNLWLHLKPENIWNWRPLEEEIPNLEIESVSVSVSPFRYLKAQESHAPRTRIRFWGEMTICPYISMRFL